MGMVPPLQSRYAVLPLFLVAVLFIFLGPVFWIQTELLYSGAGLHENLALYQRVYPQFAYGFGQLAAGSLPLWNPYQLCGTPFLSDPLSGVFQPLNAVFLLAPTERAMAAQAFLSLFLMGQFFALFLRSLGARYMSAVFAGVLYAFSGATAAAMSRPELAAALAWTPLLFWAGHEFMRSKRLGMAVLAGIGGAGLILSGAFALAVPFAILLLGYLLLRMLFRPRGVPLRPGRTLAGFAVLLLVAAGISAVQLLPALFWFDTLANPAAAFWRLDVAGHIPAHFEALYTQLLTGQADVLARLAYVGIVPLLLWPAAFFHREGRLEAFYFALGLAASVALAFLLREHGPPAYPAFALFFPAAFCAAVLAGLGFDRMLAVTRDPRSPLVWIPILLLVVLAVGVLLVASAYVRALVFLAMLLLLPFFLLRTRWMAALSGALLTLLLFLDLTIANTNYYRHPYADGPLLSPTLSTLAREAEEQALRGRILISAHPHSEVLPANLGMLAAVRSAGGRQIPLTREQDQWWALLRGEATPAAPITLAGVTAGAAAPRLLNHMAARVILSTEDGGLSPGRFERDEVPLELWRSRAGVRVYTNPAAQPRLSWVPRWQIVPDMAAALEVLQAPDFAANGACVVIGDAAALEARIHGQPASDGDTVDGALATTTISDPTPERVVIEVEAPHPGIVVLADSFAPGWQATLNGAPVPILQVNGLFRGISVPPGAHEIVFRYRPWPVYAGLGLSLGTLVLLLLSAFWAVRPRRKRVTAD